MEKKSIQLNAEVTGAAEAAKDGTGVNRRSFMVGMGAMMAGAAIAAVDRKMAQADETEDEDEEAVEETAEETAEEETETTASTLTGWTGTPEDLLALGISTMPLDDLNEYRRKYLEAQTDYTMEDGTVVPAVYVKLRSLVHSYGSGCGNTPYDTTFPGMMSLFTEDEAQGFLDMPWGVEFTAYEMAAATGRTEEECTELCEKFGSEGYILMRDADRGRVYHQVPYFQGITEYQYSKVSWEDYTTGVKGSDFSADTANTGTPTFYYVPVDKSVTSDGTILPFDDLKEKIKSKNLVAICPCPCRYGAMIRAYGEDGDIPSFEDFLSGEYEDYFSPICDRRVETCIMTGDEAAYWIEMGWGRQITGEQAAEYLQRSVDDGFMLETTFGKNSDTICSCESSSCGILMQWAAVGDAETIASCTAFKQISHYTLEVDPDKCIACGLCVDRCPMQIITINDDGWAEPAANCFRCGQCAYICPQGARVLVQRDESELAPLPQGMLEDANVKAAYRFEMGLITI